jgi:hypothetical protein
MPGYNPKRSGVNAAASNPLQSRMHSSESDLPPDESLRRELQVASDQVHRGEVSDLDMDALLAEAHRRYAARLDEQEPNHH